MSEQWESFQTQVRLIQQEFDKSYKCLNKTKLPSAATQAKHINNLVLQHNLLATGLKTLSPILTETHLFEIENIFKGIKIKLKAILRRLEISDPIPEDCTTILNLKIIEPESEEEESENNSKEKPGSSKDVKMPLSMIEFLNTASKLIPEYDGKPEELQSFLNALDLVNSIKDVHEQVAVNIIKTKTKGKALTAINSATSIETIKTALKQKIKTESVETITAKLMATKQENKDSNTFIKEIEELSEKLQNAYILDGSNPTAAEQYATKAAVKSIKQNARNHETKMLMKAGQFKTLDDAITQFVELSTESQDTLAINYVRSNNRYRGRGRKNFNRNTHYNGPNNHNQNNNNNNGRNYRNQNRYQRNRRNGQYNNSSNRNNSNAQNIRNIDANPENGLAPQQQTMLGSYTQ